LSIQAKSSNNLCGRLWKGIALLQDGVLIL